MVKICNDILRITTKANKREQGISIKCRKTIDSFENLKMLCKTKQKSYQVTI